TSGPEAMRDLDRAEGLYKRSADADCPQGKLGYALALLRRNDPALAATAAGFLRGAAAASLPTAEYMLGVITEQGQGLPADREAATELYRLAAAKGLRSAQARYGFALMHGLGVERNLQEGESWLRRAALQGDPEAAALVGDLYSRGGELPPN